MIEMGFFDRSTMRRQGNKTRKLMRRQEIERATREWQLHQMQAPTPAGRTDAQYIQWMEHRIRLLEQRLYGLEQRFAARPTLAPADPPPSGISEG